MFLKTQDPKTAKELADAGFELVDKRCGCWVFMDTQNFDLTDRQKKYVVKSSIVNM